MYQRIYPIEDMRPHDLEGENCWCNPLVEDSLVIHNSADGCESYEQGRELQ